MPGDGPIMARFIAPICEWLLGVLQSAPMGELEPFAEFHKSWTGVAMNWPPVAVMPRSSAFDPEITGVSHSENLLTVKFGVNGPDPDQVAADAMAYMAAIDAAITAAPWPLDVKRVFVQQHDYGMLYERSGNFAKFPELHLLVEVYER